MSEGRARLAALFDAEINRHYQRFRAVADIQAEDRVLDVGCGTGESTRDAATAAVEGYVLGVDISEALLGVARQRSAGLSNVDYQLADAQTHRFAPSAFDVCISRFGTMFFADPEAAFRNIARAVRPGGRLVLLVWQTRDRNEWSTAVRDAIGAGQAPQSGPDAFSLGDPAVARSILSTAGFTEVQFLDVHEPVYYGPDVDTAFDLVSTFLDTREWLAGLPAEAAKRANARLRELLAAHHTSDGVLFDSKAWIITARRDGR